MKNFKLGFTIAEVATALAIVGVVAALVMPLVVKNVQKQQAGPLLGRAVQQIELGCMNLVQYANSNVIDGSHWDSLADITFKDIVGDSASSEKLFSDNVNFIKLLAPYIGAVKVDIDWNKIPVIKNFDGSNGSLLIVNTMIKTGETYKFNNTQTELSIANYLGTITGTKWVFIDVNGWNRPPNTFGKDIFEFDWVNSSCKLKPYAPNVTNGLQYTKQIVKDGFKIKYY